MRAIVALALATLAAAILFVGWPGIDLAASRAVFRGERRFWLTDAPFAVAINTALPTIVLVTVAAILCAAVIGHVRRVPALAFRRMLFLVLSFAVGPGLIVNALLKEYWGRARPNDVVAFGGGAQFTPALIPADQCAGNCSFVSGDVSIAFAYVAIALLLPARWRAAGIVAALAFGGFVAALRFLQGAHFLSDVVFAALFTLLPVAIFARLLLSPDRRG